jgi:hypothetical protein
LFFVGIEGTGGIHAYALDQIDGGFVRVASISSSFPGVMELQFDRDLSELWAVCDNTCNGQHALLRINPLTGIFGVAFKSDRPTGMPNYNNEGFAIAPAAQCVNSRKPVYWADDTENLNVSIRSGNIPCVAFFEEAPLPELAKGVLVPLLAVGMLVGLLALNRRLSSGRTAGSRRRVGSRTRWSAPPGGQRR